MTNQGSDSDIEKSKQLRIHYYVKIAVSTFLCALLLIIGVPVFMESRVTGSLAYTALGVVLVGFGLVLAAAVVVLLFRPPSPLKQAAQDDASTHANAVH